MRELTKLITLITAIAMGLLAVPVAADYAESDWRFYKAIEIHGDADGDSLVEVPIDAQAFEGSLRGLADLRVVDQTTGVEAQYKLVVERPEHRRSAVMLDMRDFGTVAGQHTRFVLAIRQPGSVHNEIEINTSSRNFQRRVTVEASADGDVWTMLEDNAEVYDFTIADRGITTRDTHARYPISTAALLRITIVNGDESPIDVQGATGFFFDDISARKIEWPATVATRSQAAEGNITHTVFDLGGSGRPINQLDIQTSQVNFYRNVNFAGSNDALDWTPLRSTAVIYSFDAPRFRGNELSVSFANSIFQYYRVSVLDEDNPPLESLTGSFYGPSHSLMFQPQPGANYALFYGNAEARTPSYELEHLLPYLITENLPSARLGAQTLNPTFRLSPLASEPFTERYPWLLPIALAVGGLFIGFFLTRLWVEVKKKLPPPPAG